MPLTQQHACVCDVRLMESAGAAELYVTAAPAHGDPTAGAAEVYEHIARVLRGTGARIVQERLFAGSAALPTVLAQRTAALGDLDDGVEPTLLATRDADGPLVGVQVHAVAGIAAPAMLRQGGAPRARSFTFGGCRYLSASGLSAPAAGDESEQTLAVFEAAEALLAHGGGTLHDVARTWIWMDDILDWYSQLNQIRSNFFRQRGLMTRAGQMPASTGIGVSPARGRIGLDVFAAWGREDAVTRYHAAGRQRSAYEYGSAFARAARTLTPAGSTVFCSGTAAIDTQGRTCFVGDVAGQVAMTLDNVRAVLADLDCADADVVQALVYCATPAVREHFMACHSPRLTWPCLVMFADVCRADLLFEVEVTACPGAAPVLRPSLP